MKDTIVTILAIIGVLVVLVVGMVGLSNWFGDMSCHARYPDYKPEFSMITGCMIEVNGKRIPSDRFRVL